MKEPFLINPPRRRYSYNRVRRHKNPFGESLMIAGLNPFRGRARARGLFRSNEPAWFGHSKAHAKAARKGWRKNRYRRNEPAWFGHSKAHAKAARKGWRRNRYRRNPAGVMAPVERMIGYDLPTFGNLTGAGTGIILTASMPRMTNMTATAFQRYGVEIATVLGGGFLVGMLPSPKMRTMKGFGAGYIVGGIGWIAAEFIREFILPMIPGMPAGLKGYGDYAVGTPAFAPGYVSTGEMGDYKILGDVGAFPPTGFGAFPGVDVGYGYGHGDTDLSTFEYQPAAPGVSNY